MMGASGAISGVLGAWIGLQVLNASMSGGAGSGTAWWAHVGGFIAGAALIVPFRHKSVPLFDGKSRRPRRSIIPDSRKGPWGWIGAGVGPQAPRFKQNPWHCVYI